MIQDRSARARHFQDRAPVERRDVAVDAAVLEVPGEAVRGVVHAVVRELAVAVPEIPPAEAPLRELSPWSG